jgi:ABC-type antimicrobial peptide transport system permease subunit
MFFETVKLSIRTIARNALRSFLTVLGVVIGVGAVIVMVTLGEGTTAAVTSEVAKLGTNILIVRPGQAGFGPASFTASLAQFTPDDVEAIETQIQGIGTVAPTDARGMTAIYGNLNHAMQVTGTDNRYLVARDWIIGSGRAFTDAEVNGGTAACIVGETVRLALFGDTDPIGETIRLRDVPCKIIAVLAKKGAAAFGQDPDDVILVPLRMLQRRISGNPGISTVFIAVANGYSTSDVQGEITNLLRERRAIDIGERDNFNVTDMAQVTSTLTTVIGALTGLLSAIAGVSLLVGGIGIMNIMLVSVTERTREIGIRRAIGAEGRQVLMQFLVEAGVLSLFGGVIGVGLGLGLAALAARFLNVPFVVNPLMVVVAFAFSALIGVAFGYFPARRAARLDPIEALRHE